MLTKPIFKETLHAKTFDGNMDHQFWDEWNEKAPGLLAQLRSDKYRPDKLFVEIHPKSTSWMFLVNWLRRLDQRAALYKKAITGYYCCYAIFYGAKPRQCAHVEHEQLKFDLDHRIIDNYETEYEAYSTALKALAGRQRYYFIDHNGVEWIAVPWYWKQERISKAGYRALFERCFASEYLLYVRKTVERFEDEEAILEIDSWVLAKK